MSAPTKLKPGSNATRKRSTDVSMQHCVGPNQIRPLDEYRSTVALDGEVSVVQIKLPRFLIYFIAFFGKRLEIPAIMVERVNIAFGLRPGRPH